MFTQVNIDRARHVALHADIDMILLKADARASLQQRIGYGGGVFPKTGDDADAGDNYTSGHGYMRSVDG